MLKNNTSRVARETQVLPLLQAGSQGWKNPQPNQSLIRELRSPHKTKTLKTKQIKDRLHIPQRYIQKCEMGVVLAWDAYLIWHQGRDRWAIYERSAV